MQLLILALLSLLCSFGLAEEQQMLNLNGAMATRTFDGIGGLSGGGATSRLLVDYPEPQKSQILDYLFLPNFGASLHILKVEIGGDCQTTDGTEPSHMHTRDDQNYERGYEWWLMVEAKKRNPNIKLYALSWGVPGWIGNGNYFSNDNVMYQVNWIKGAKRVYGLDIDYIGIWNERSFTDDRNCTYIKNLRAGLDVAGFTNTKIVAADGDWSIVGYLQNDADLRKAVHTVGVHYPGTTSPEAAKNLYEQYGIPLWASEDYSTYSNNVGDGCWSRILNQNWVNGYMTGTISWNLIAAYYPSLPFGGDGLSWAWYPWSGNYDITGTVWGSAHITQFAYPGWKYLGHGYGSGHLPKGGSYVTLVPPEEKGDFSLIIETMTHDNSICIRPNLPPYTVENQTVTFNLMHLNQRGPLHAWYTHFSANGNEVVYFKQLPDIHPVNGQFSVTLDLDSIVTITTTTGQKKGSYPTPPAPSPFPLPYSDNFESYAVSSEAKYFADQTGVWEINQGPRGKTMKQMVPAPPITWCGEAQSPITFIGSNSLSSVLVELDAWVVGGQINVGCRASSGGCTNNYGTGYFLWVGDDGKWSVYAGSSKQLGSGTLPWPKNTFNRLSLSCNQDTITAKFNNKILGSFTDSTHQSGFVSVGSSWQGDVQFDNFNISGVPANCGQGNHVNVAPCGQNAITWVINSDGSIRPRNDNNLCLDLKGTNPKTGAPAAVVSPCDVSSNPNQVWSWSESSKTITNKFSGKCLDIASQDTAPCATVEVWDCNSGTNQAWAYNEKTGVIITFLDGGCLGIGAA